MSHAFPPSPRGYDYYFASLFEADRLCETLRRAIGAVARIAEEQHCDPARALWFVTTAAGHGLMLYVALWRRAA